jgi:hypothetical protein
MPEYETQPQELSTSRDNFLTVTINLSTGQSRVLNGAETARAAADATGRQADNKSALLVLASSAL